MRNKMIFRKLKSKKKIIILITVPITLYMMFFFNFEQEKISEVNNLSSYEKLNVEKHDLKAKKKSSNIDKWIIVTSINQPTEQIKKLASIKEFNLLVVEDKKTNNLLSYEKFDIFFKKFDKICFRNYNQKKNLTLLTPDKNTSIHLNAYKVDLSYYGLSAAELFSLLKRVNAILLDIEILKNIKIQFDVLSYIDGLKHVSDFPKRSSLITFGIHPDSFHQLNEILIEQSAYNQKKIFYFQDIQKYKNKEILSSVYVRCGHFFIQIVILYDRGDFIWINEDSFKLDGKIFGDVARAINRFEIVEFEDQDSNSFNIPADIKKYLFEYDHSAFLECDLNLADRIKKEQKQDVKKNEEIEQSIDFITKKLESFNAHYWLGGGTLLGWYRDCGIIPHTTDVDFCLFADEYKREIPKYFFGNKVYPIVMSQGVPKEGYELRIRKGSFTYDLFFTYKDTANTTFQWTTYHDKAIFRRWLPYFEKVCSAELLNHKVMVPCDPVEYLNAEYGVDSWQEPKTSLSKSAVSLKIGLEKEMLNKTEYTWPNLKFYRKYTDEEALNVRWYFQNSSIDYGTNIGYINRRLSKELNVKQIRSIIDNKPRIY